jgi:hypothetical protein
MDRTGRIRHLNTETKPSVPLRIKIRDQDMVSAGAELGRQIDRNCRFSGPTLPVRDGENSRKHQI